MSKRSGTTTSSSPRRGRPRPRRVRRRRQPPRRVTDIVPDAEADDHLHRRRWRRRRTSPRSIPSAQIATPAHGYTVLKVAEMLQSEHIRALPAEVKQKSIMVALDAAGVKVADIIEDAVQRDRALDTYERVLQKHLEDLRAQKDRREPAARGRDQPARRRAARADRSRTDAELTDRNRRTCWPGGPASARKRIGSPRPSATSFRRIRSRRPPRRQTREASNVR